MNRPRAALGRTRIMHARFPLLICIGAITEDYTVAGATRACTTTRATILLQLPRRIV